MRSVSVRLILLTTCLIACTLFTAETYPTIKAHRMLSAAVSCADLASSLFGSPGIKAAESHLVPPSGPNVGYCQANILYGAHANQNINTRVGSRRSGVGAVSCSRSSALTISSSCHAV